MTSLDITVRTPEDLGSKDAVASYTEGYTFVIKNNENFPVAFKAFTQRPQLYTFAPAFGVVMPRTAIAVTIRLRVPTFYCRFLEGSEAISMLSLAEGGMAKSGRRRRRRSTVVVGEEGRFRQSSTASKLHDDAGEEGETASEGDTTSDDDEGDFSSSYSDGEGDVDKTPQRRRKKKSRRTSGGRLEHVSSYLKTQIDSGTFKVEIRVLNTHLGVGVAETAYLSHQHGVEMIAVKDLQRREKAKFLALKKREFNKRRRRLQQYRRQQAIQNAAAGDSSQSFSSSSVSSEHSAAGNITSENEDSTNRMLNRSYKNNNNNNNHNFNLSAPFSEKDVLEFYDETNFKPSHDALQRAIAEIRGNASKLFDHLWAVSGVPLSTHTITCRTMKEDISTFYSKIISFQEKSITELNEQSAGLKKEVGYLTEESTELLSRITVLERRQRLRMGGVPPEFIEMLISPPPPPHSSSSQAAAISDGIGAAAAAAAGSASFSTSTDAAAAISVATEMVTLLGLVHDDEKKKKTQRREKGRKKVSLMIPLWMVLLVAVAAFCMGFYQDPMSSPLYSQKSLCSSSTT